MATSGAASFHDLTGGVYKAQERIHRGVADPRLLAIQLHAGELQPAIRTGAGFCDLLHLAVLRRSVPAIVARVQPWA